MFLRTAEKCQLLRFHLQNWVYRKRVVVYLKSGARSKCHVNHLQERELDTLFGGWLLQVYFKWRMKKWKKESRPDKPAHSSQAANLHLRRHRALLRYHFVCRDFAPRSSAPRSVSVAATLAYDRETMSEVAAAIALLLLVASSASINGEGTIL